jgi:hypothetical protein
MVSLRVKIFYVNDFKIASSGFLMGEFRDNADLSVVT